MANPDLSASGGVEHLLNTAAHNKQLPVRGLEDPRALIRHLNAMNYQQQQDLLLESTHYHDDQTIDNDSLICAWRRGDEKALRRHVSYVAKTYPLYFNTLIRQRTTSWFDTLDERLQNREVTLVVLGFNHLYGQHGLLAHFRHQHLNMRRIQ